VKLAVRVCCFGHGLVGASGGGAVQGRGVRSALVWRLAGICKWPDGRDALVLSRRCASV
jgi:hypothetical protein